MVLVLLLVLFTQSPAACADVSDCRTQALAARAAGDYERFHDLAWRAVQKGKPNDPELMFMLARAQSLSGRPDDALVMLGRLADMGFVRDVSKDEDFARVRALKRWVDLEARLRAGAPDAPPPAPPREAAAAPRAPDAPPAGLDFDPAQIDAVVGLARDAVSKRLVLGDRRAGRLVVIDEVSHHVVNLVSAASAGFYADVTGFAIDPHRGDLWVVSTQREDGETASRLHKLQLVSGRSLEQIEAPPGARLAGVAVAADGTVYAIDAASSRLLRLHAGARSLETVMHLEANPLTALTVADDHALFVVAGDALLRVDPAARHAAPVKGGEHLAGVASLGWHSGALLVVEHKSGGTALVRVALDSSGSRVTGSRVLAASIQDGSPVGIAGNTVYYLEAPGKIGRIDVR